MELLTIIGLAIGLAMDAFAVAISTGFVLPEITRRHYFRLGFHFGLFQALMPLLGWMAGRSMAVYIEHISHWIAFGLLGFIGGKMIYESFQPPAERPANDPTRGIQLVVLSIATSIDALAIGFSLAIIGVEIVLPALIIGIVTLCLTLIGMKLGEKLGLFLGSKMEKMGGAVLIGIGIKILIENLI